MEPFKGKKRDWDCGNIAAGYKCAVARMRVLPYYVHPALCSMRDACALCKIAYTSCRTKKHRERKKIGNRNIEKEKNIVNKEQRERNENEGGRNKRPRGSRQEEKRKEERK